MGNLKDSLNHRKKTVTLSGEQIDFLMRINQYAQNILTQLQESIAAEYLRMIAVREHGMNPNKNLGFDFHPELESDNLTIIEKDK